MSATVKVSNISPKATEHDLWDFFAFSGEIQGIQVQSVDAAFSQTAFVTFADEKALETALLLTGAVIVDRPVTVEVAVGYQPPPSTQTTKGTQQPPSQETVDPSVQKAEDVVSNLLAKGYILSKDAMGKARAFDERHQLSKTAAERAAAIGQSASSTAASLDRKMGLSQRISAGATTVNESFKAVDEKYKVVDKSKAAFATAEQKVNEAAAVVMKFPAVAKSAAWLTGAFGRVAKVAEDVTVKTKGKVQEQEGIDDRVISSPNVESTPGGQSNSLPRPTAEPLLGAGPAVLPYESGQQKL